MGFLCCNSAVQRSLVTAPLLAVADSDDPVDLVVIPQASSWCCSSGGTLTWVLLQKNDSS